MRQLVAAKFRGPERPSLYKLADFAVLPEPYGLITADGATPNIA